VRLDKGEYLALPDVQNFSPDVLGLRSVNDESVEALVLNQQAFQNWMADDRSVLNNLSTAAQTRLTAWRTNGGTN
jgi:hypothetical protein